MYMQPTTTETEYTFSFYRDYVKYYYAYDGPGVRTQYTAFRVFCSYVIGSGETWPRPWIDFDLFILMARRREPHNVVGVIYYIVI
jgi:hypothetical protein